MVNMKEQVELMRALLSSQLTCSGHIKGYIKVNRDSISVFYLFYLQAFNALPRGEFRYYLQCQQSVGVNEILMFSTRLSTFNTHDKVIARKYYSSSHGLHGSHLQCFSQTEKLSAKTQAPNTCGKRNKVMVFTIQNSDLFFSLWLKKQKIRGIHLCCKSS